MDSETFMDDIMDDMTMNDTIVGKSLLKKNKVIETDPSIIQKNELSFLSYLMSFTQVGHNPEPMKEDHNNTTQYAGRT
jgi:hypothetical protein